MPRHELAKANNIQYNSLHIHKSNVKLPELDIFKSAYSSYILTYVSLS